MTIRQSGAMSGINHHGPAPVRLHDRKRFFVLVVVADVDGQGGGVWVGGE